MNITQSIRKRLRQDVVLRGGIISAITTLVVLVALSLIIWQFLVNRLERRVENSLVDRHEVAHKNQTELSDAERASIRKFRKRLPVRAEGVFVLLDPDGNSLVGSVIGPDCREGFYDLWVDITQSALDAPLVTVAKNEAIPSTHDRFRFLASPRGENCMVFGKSMFAVEATKQSVLGLLIWLVPLCLLPAWLISIRQSLNLRRRLLHMKTVVQSVSMGDFSQRIAVEGDDDIDQLGCTANTSIDRLQESVGTLQQLTTVVAHDLRSPLNRIAIPLDRAITANEAGETDVDSLELVKRQLTDAQSIFDALLRISQIESGQRRSKFTEIDLFAIAEVLYEIYQPVVEDAESTLEFEVIGEGTSIIHGDSDLLRQALVNLIENATRYTPKRSIIRICVTRDLNHPELAVRDNGPGLPEEERPKVLKRLYRYEGSTAGKSGNGLGLSLVKAVSELHLAELLIEDANPGLAILLRFTTGTHTDQ